MAVNNTEVSKQPFMFASFNNGEKSVDQTRQQDESEDKIRC